jgi:hypothetical protein
LLTLLIPNAEDNRCILLIGILDKYPEGDCESLFELLGLESVDLELGFGGKRVLGGRLSLSGQEKRVQGLECQLIMERKSASSHLTEEGHELMHD